MSAEKAEKSIVRIWCLKKPSMKFVMKTRKYNYFYDSLQIITLARQLESMKKRVLGRILYYAIHFIGFGLLYLVLRNFDWQSFKSLFSFFSVFDFIIGFALLILVYLIKSLRWMLINRTFGIRLTYGNTLIYFMVSGFLSVITPGRIGEFSKIFFIKRKTGASGMLATSSVVLDRVWDVLILTMLGGIGALLVFGRFQINTFTIILILAFFLLALSIILFPVLIFMPLKYFTKKNEKLQGEIDQIYEDWKKNAIKLFLPGFFSTLFAFLILALIPLIFTNSLGQGIGIIPSISAVSISNMLAFLPITVAGFGTRELVFSEIWKILEYSAESAITISTAYFICNYLGSLVLGGFTYLLWFKKHFSLKEIVEIKSE
jgi:uncharacterized protein (TIRG00374 family)